MAKSDRSSAKASAIGSAQTSASTSSTGGRRPGQPAESANTTENQAAEAAPAPPLCLVRIATNPKRANTKAHGYFEKYPAQGVKSDFMTARRNQDGSERVRGKDISWDADRRHILLGDEAENFPYDGTREEKCAYLKALPKSDAGFTVTDKQLIAWGYMDAPVETPAEANTEQKADA